MKGWHKGIALANYRPNLQKKCHVNFLNRKAKTINTTEAWANNKKVKNPLQ